MNNNTNVMEVLLDHGDTVLDYACRWDNEKAIHLPKHYWVNCSCFCSVMFIARILLENLKVHEETLKIHQPDNCSRCSCDNRDSWIYVGFAGMNCCF